MSAEKDARCNAERRWDPNWNTTWIACVLDRGHSGEHFSTRGCAGSEMRWTDPDSAAKDAGLRDALVALLREYTAGAYMTLNQNRDAMIRAGAIPGSSGGDVIRAGLGDWPESFLTTRWDLVDDVREAVTPDA